MSTFQLGDESWRYALVQRADQAARDAINVTADDDIVFIRTHGVQMYMRGFSVRVEVAVNVEASSDLGWEGHKRAIEARLEELFTEFRAERAEIDSGSARRFQGPNPYDSITTPVVNVFKGTAEQFRTRKAALEYAERIERSVTSAIENELRDRRSEVRSAPRRSGMFGTSRTPKSEPAYGASDEEEVIWVDVFIPPRKPLVVLVSRLFGLGPNDDKLHEIVDRVVQAEGGGGKKLDRTSEFYSEQGTLLPEISIQPVPVGRSEVKDVWYVVGILTAYNIMRQTFDRTIDDVVRSVWRLTSPASRELTIQARTPYRDDRGAYYTNELELGDTDIWGLDTLTTNADGAYRGNLPRDLDSRVWFGDMRRDNDVQIDFDEFVMRDVYPSDQLESLGARMVALGQGLVQSARASRATSDGRGTLFEDYDDKLREAAEVLREHDRDLVDGDERLRTFTDSNLNVILPAASREQMPKRETFRRGQFSRYNQRTSRGRPATMEGPPIPAYIDGDE